MSVNCNRSKHPHNALQWLVNRNLKTFSTSQSIFCFGNYWMQMNQCSERTNGRTQELVWGSLEEHWWTALVHWWTTLVDTGQQRWKQVSEQPAYYPAYHPASLPSAELELVSHYQPNKERSTSTADQNLKILVWTNL